jgi:hypothetical protein
MFEQRIRTDPLTDACYRLCCHPDQGQRMQFGQLKRRKFISRSAALRRRESPQLT